MFIYITAQILRTFHFSFPLLRHSPPTPSFNYTFTVYFIMKEYCHYPLVRKFFKKRIKVLILHFLIFMVGT